MANSGPWVRRLIEWDCPHLGLEPTEEKVLALFFHPEDRILILSWILGEIHEHQREDKENVDTVGAAPVINLQTVLEQAGAPDLEAQLVALGIPSASAFLSGTSSREAALGIWTILVQFLEYHKVIKPAQSGQPEDDLAHWLDHPLTRHSEETSSAQKLIPRDIERDLPKNFKKLAVPSEEKSHQIVSHFQAELARIQDELASLPEIPQTDAPSGDESVAVLDSLAEDLYKFNLDMEPTSQRLRLQPEEPEAKSFGEPLQVIEAGFRSLDEILTARESIGKVLRDTSEILGPRG